MKALIVIDYTNDFVHEKGALTCGKPGQVIEERITALTQTFAIQGDVVVMAVDLHWKGDPYHPETKRYPPHNIKGTRGRHLYGTLQPLFTQLQTEHPDRVYWMDKTRYSAFTGTNLDIYLRVRGITELHLVGVCTDICVLHTAVDAYNKGYDVMIHEDAVASFNQTGHEWALGHFQNQLGFQVIRAEG